MFAVTVAFIVIVTLVFVGYPLIRSARPKPFLPEDADDPARIRARLAEIELDFHMGLLSEEDYRKLASECEETLSKRGERP